MTKSWSVENITNQLRACEFAMQDPRMTGYVTWECKKDIFKIKFVLDEILDNSPTYIGEEAWLNEQAKEKTWKIISR
jgi:hypothetical protein